MQWTRTASLCSPLTPTVRPAARRSPCLGQPLAFTTHRREPDATGAPPQRPHLTTYPLTSRAQFVVAHSHSSRPRRPRTQRRASKAVDGSPTLARRPPRRRLQATVLIVQSIRPPHLRFRLSRWPAVPFSWSWSVGPSPAPPPRSAHARETPKDSQCPASQHRRPPGSHRQISAPAKPTVAPSRVRRQPRPSSTRPVSIRPA